MKNKGSITNPFSSTYSSFLLLDDVALVAASSRANSCSFSKSASAFRRNCDVTLSAGRSLMSSVRVSSPSERGIPPKRDVEFCGEYWVKKVNH